ncbi:MAG TPA: hypothetical protein VFD89_06610, partial [Clostridia bacterium]|nr:hypothetical protein [Clostridia bacterium]
YVIELINKILNLNEGQSNKENKHIVMDSSEFGNGEESPDAIDDPNQEHDDEEIVAVIAAAVAASLSYSTHDIIVRSIRRISSNTPAWNRAGRSQQIAGKL